MNPRRAISALMVLMESRMTGQTSSTHLGVAFGRTSFRFGAGNALLGPTHRFTCCGEALVERFHDVRDWRGRLRLRLARCHLTSLNFGRDERLHLFAVVVSVLVRLEL